MIVRNVSWTSNKYFNLPAWHNKSWFEGHQLLWGHPELVDWKIIQSIKQFDEVVEKFQNDSCLRKILYVPLALSHGQEYLHRIICSRLLISLEQPMPFEKLVPLSKKYSEPMLALVLEKQNDKNLVNDLTILIPHWESLHFIKVCIESIKNAFPILMPRVIVLDDYSETRIFSELKEYCRESKVDVYQVWREDQRKVADVGALLDFGLLLVSTKYVCMLDADTIILDPEAFSRPIQMLEEEGMICVGLDTGLASSYHANHTYNGISVKSSSFNLPGEFTVVNNLYRVMRTMDAVNVSRVVGFSRKVSMRTWRDQIGRGIRRIDSILSERSRFKGFSRELIKCRLLNSQFPQMPPTSDNGVNANGWMDANAMGWKGNIPITSYGVISKSDGICFQNISNLLIHVALSTRALSTSRREVGNAGDDFYKNVQEIYFGDNIFSEVKEKALELSLRNKI